jgi:hypothetical protein
MIAEPRKSAFRWLHPVGQRFSYIRVSSADQNLARQREMIGTVDKEFLDKLSALTGQAWGAESATCGITTS